ncbi:unnamed protein product [Lactuca virosa]|uniref:Receptor-like serine/threonine-protein kinase n=1 Tax=Lactuca virosa TaxID=75947 RepID=A0AAU9PM28_9ASTR|nr:unnamed protein product [Lactuca virosa]
MDLLLHLLMLVSLILSQTPLTTSSSSPPYALKLGSSLFVDNKDDVLISPDNVFTAGFYSVGNNAFCFSIWFTKPLSTGSHTVVWMANRDAPVNGKRSKLSLTKTGNLVLQDADQDLPIWTTRTRDLTDSAELKLNNSGNLYLQSKDEKILWQSFGFPTDTLLPNQPLTKESMLVSSRSKTNHSSGFYRLFFDSDNVLRLVYSGPKVTGVYWPNPELRAWDAGRSTYGSERTAAIDTFGRFISSDGWFFNSSDDGIQIMRRVTIDIDGNLRVYSLNENRTFWKVTWQAMAQTCMIHGSCGENSTCSNQPTYGRKCTCLPYHKMVNRTDWSYGCEPEFEQSLCGNGEDSFLHLPHFDFYGYDLKYLPNVTLDVCKEECMNMCSCKGFQYKFDKKQGIFLCYPKFLLLNGFSSVSFNGSLYLRVPKVTLSSKTTKATQELGLNCSGHPMMVELERVYDKKNDRGSIKFLLLFTYVFGALEVVCIIYFFYKTRKSVTKSQGYLQAATGFERFSYRDLRKASENFSMEMITGRSPQGGDQSGGYERRMVKWVREKVADGYGGKSNWIEEIVDSTVKGEYDRIRMGNLIKVALQCAEEIKDARPTMSQHLRHHHLPPAPPAPPLITASTSAPPPTTPPSQWVPPPHILSFSPSVSFSYFVTTTSYLFRQYHRIPIPTPPITSRPQSSNISYILFETLSDSNLELRSASHEF